MPCCVQTFLRLPVAANKILYTTQAFSTIVWSYVRCSCHNPCIAWCHAGTSRNSAWAFAKNNCVSPLGPRQLLIPNSMQNYQKSRVSSHKVYGITPPEDRPTVPDRTWCTSNHNTTFCYNTNYNASTEVYAYLLQWLWPIQEWLAKARLSPERDLNA